MEHQDEKHDQLVGYDKIENIPVGFGKTEQAITYNSSPQRISRQYQESGSPPKVKQKRAKLYHSPAEKRERKEDNDAEYNWYPDSISAMRANDLHCGRGSSPLRTKFKNSPTVRSVSASPVKTDKSLYYEIDDGQVSIKTPVKLEPNFCMFEQSPGIRDAPYETRESPSPNRFRRRCKVSVENTVEKLNKEQILMQQRARILNHK